MSTQSIITLQVGSNGVSHIRRALKFWNTTTAKAEKTIVVTRPVMVEQSKRRKLTEQEKLIQKKKRIQRSLTNG